VQQLVEIQFNRLEITALLARLFLDFAACSGELGLIGTCLPAGRFVICHLEFDAGWITAAQ